ncbi:MAG: mucoidy inhibitor MuiA family protein [Chitinispirillaceae bacterium]|nr:mucoidy inhibitor MuiA family protein [Chitinispirillaceae bacterium]
MAAKKYGLLRLSLCALAAAGYAFNGSAERTVTSKVTAVTVFSDRAQVVRTCGETLPAGGHELVFDNLPAAIERTSLAMEGSGSGMLREVKFRRMTAAENTDSLSLVLAKQKRKIEEALAETDDRIKLRTGERQFLENISLKVTGRGASERAAPPELDTAKWQKMAAFYRNRLEALTRDLRAAERVKRDLADSLAAINRKIAELGRSVGTERNQAVVTLFMKEQGKLTLNLSYIVYGPSWTPAYELRMASAKKKLKMTYKGTLRQNTGEDWADAEIRLSTAQAYVGGNQPELSPWHINFYSPEPYPQYRLQKSAARGPKLAAPAPSMANLMEAEAPAPEAAPAPPPALETVQAGVESGSLNAVFAIPGKTTVASDNQAHTVTITTRELPASFRYSTVPRLSARAYLKAKAINETDFPLLKGASSVFLDNTFVTNSTLENVAPGQEFWTFLGVDEAMKVEHKRLNRFEKDQGLLGKKRKVAFDYLITVTNNRKTEEEIVVWDQLPIPGDGDIKVELVEPKWKENTAGLKKNETQYLEWYFKMKAGEKIKIPFKFTVEYPEGKTVTGL